MGTSQKRKLSGQSIYQKKKNLFNSTSILENGGKNKLVVFKYN